MENVLLKVITNNEGQIIHENLKSIIPDYMAPVQAMKHVMNIIAKTKLNDKFIERYFSQLPLDIVLEYNSVPETIIRNKFELVIPEILNDIFINDDIEILQLLFKQDYSADLYEQIITSIIVYLMNETHDVEEQTDLFTQTINAYCEMVSKDFILKNLHEYGYYAITAAMERNDISVEDLVANIDKISLDEITTWISEFQDNERDEDTLFNTSNWNMLVNILSVKAMAL
jgi:hypothetical protein